MTARTLYTLPGPLPLTPSQLGLLGRFKLTSRTLETVRAELWTDAGADVVNVTNPGDSVAFPLLGLRAVHLSASGYPANILLESTELPLELDCAVQVGNTLTNPIPVHSGGVPGGCLWATPWPLPSPVDLLGGYMTAGGYVQRTPPWPAVGSVLSGPISLYGIPNSQFVGYGISPGVLAGGVMSAEWVYSLPGARHVCTAEMDTYGDAGLNLAYIELLADGVQVIAPGGWTGYPNPTPLSPAALGTVWTIRYAYTHGGGFYSGLDLRALLLWPLGL